MPTVVDDATLLAILTKRAATSLVEVAAAGDVLTTALGTTDSTVPFTIRRRRGRCRP